MKNNKRKEEMQEIAILWLSRILMAIVIIFIIIVILVLRDEKKWEKEIFTYVSEPTYSLHIESIPMEEQMKWYVKTLPLPKEEISVIATDETYENFANQNVTTLYTTAYCPCMECCEKTDAITASGRVAKQWHTVAAGRKYPIGTKIYIPELADKPNGGWFEVEDRGGAISDDRLDVYFNTHSEALQYGRKNYEVYIYEPVL